MSQQVNIDSETLLDVVRTLSRIEANQDALKYELLGNGQPGRIQRIESDVEKHETSISSLNKSKWLMIGGLVVIGHMLEGILKFALSKIGIRI